MKHSIAYFLLEGFSRGGIQFFLLSISYYFGENIYVTLMLLVSLETLIPLFFPTNYIDALLPLFKKYSTIKITSNIFVLNVLFLLLFLLLFIFIVPYFEQYYNYDNTIVYFLILLNVFLVRWLYFSAFMRQIDEKHRDAIKIKGIPFILSLLFAMFFVFILEDKILGFFIGKTLGLFLYYLYVLFQEKISFSIDTEFLLDFLNRSKFLLLAGLLGWATGYGFLNVAHSFYTDTDTKNFAYMLNIYMIFLMVIFGVIQVARPKILRLVENISPAKKLIFFYFKIMLLYIVVALIGYVVFSLLKTIDIPNSIMNMVQNSSFSILLFLLVAAESTARIYIYSKDDIKGFTYRIINIEIIGWVLILSLIACLNIDMFLAYFLLVFIRVIFTNKYIYKRIMS